ncbi:MAG: endonuclease III [Chloroflexi bacterium]|nr:endonuclease III [Chloroflexota bacterium]
MERWSDGVISLYLSLSLSLISVTNNDLPEAFQRLRAAAKQWVVPMVYAMKQKGATAYEILIASLLSARTLDTTTMVVYPELFKLADTPQKMVKLSEPEIEHVIRRVAFSRAKAKQIQALSQILLGKYDGRVPATIQELDELPGVGRKIANLTVTMAFDQPGITVDTHVHRIVNRWGYVRTKTPDQTELALREQLPAQYWIEINGLLIPLGQNICRPTGPKCSVCPINEFCDKVGVGKSR